MRATVSASRTHPLPPLHTNPSLLSLFSQCNHPDHCYQIHGYIIKTKNSTNKFYISKLLSLHTQLGSLGHGRLLFDQTRNPNTLLWNTLMKGYDQHGSTNEILRLYLRMLQDGTAKPDFFTFPLVFKSCARLTALEFARCTHSNAFKSGLYEDIYVGNAAIDMYCRFGLLDSACQVFDEMHELDVVSWTTLVSGYFEVGDVGSAKLLFELMPERDEAAWGAMISGCARSGSYTEALSFFVGMLSCGTKATGFAIVSALLACSNSGFLNLGLCLHGYVLKCGFELSVFMGTALIDMLCKCGDVTNARKVFDGMIKKNIASWNAIIGGLALHGHGREALEIFTEMQNSDIEPNAITLSNVVCACTHAGMVEDGWHYFNYMTTKYRIEANVDHYGCMVDLLGRAGLMDRAYNLIKCMPMKPNEVVWGALLGACRIHGNLDLGKTVIEKLIELDPQNSGNYVILANMYMAIGRSEDADRVRASMKDIGVSKTAGYSSIEVDGLVHEFHSREKSHPHSFDVCRVLDALNDHLETFNYTYSVECGSKQCHLDF